MLYIYLIAASIGIAFVYKCIVTMIAAFLAVLSLFHWKSHRKPTAAVPDAVFYHNGGKMYDVATSYEPRGWYFWHEDWAHYSGPFVTEMQCREAVDKYCDEFLGPNPVKEDKNAPA